MSKSKKLAAEGLVYVNKYWSRIQEDPDMRQVNLIQSIQFTKMILVRTDHVWRCTSVNIVTLCR